MQLNSTANLASTTDLVRKPSITIKSQEIIGTQRLYAFATVLIPLVGTIIAALMIWRVGVTTLDLELLLFMFFLNGIGIEVGFHRYFSHYAFKTNNVIRAILAILGCMAGQGPVTYWVATHRRHHQYSDIPGDAHSPNLHGNDILGKLRGLQHAHIGWVFDLELTNTIVFAKDLLKDPILSKVNQLYFCWLLLGLVIPGIIGGILSQTWMGAFSGFLWGGVVRLFLAQHTTYAVNSICHFYGSRAFDTTEQSRNNALLAVPTLGGSWHNNHHAFPNSAITGLEWWQLDLGGWFIRTLAAVGLAWDVKTPTHQRIKIQKVN
ncbi:acyl-CoA desaturase [Westiellopsis prolifica IICB1]|nr:acyl-CoA desaturase [Westiellopsis prolifica IICB1]